ncbi:MAG TPA: GspE/PulE family protein [Pirellula sp.]|nr:GspE/PulE family protein [Pirellula sp.]
MDQPMRDFTDLMLTRGLISLDQLSEAKLISNKQDKAIGLCLVKLGYASGEEVAQSLAEFYKFEFIDLSTIKIPDHVIQLVPESVARENKIIPIADADETIKVLVSDPFDIETIEKLRFILNRKVETAIASMEQIQEAINKYYGQTEGESADSMLQEFTDTQIDFTETEEDKAKAEEGADENSAPVVRLVQYMIQEAVQLRASDIHVEPFEDRVRIRYRIDGTLVERDSPPRRLLGAINSRIKILANMDIAERRRAQDGRITITVGEKELDLRVSVIPTNHGQSTVMRLLDKDNIKVGVKQLGLGERDFKVFTGLIKRPNGILLVTGPTGSGKTTTLYAALNALNRPDRKIITAEDPVEYYLPGINQVEVRHNIGLDFARIIRAMLRQAPNIILVGEMRDTETAQMGIQASLTGHLVFSTLHTNDAPSAVTRMTDMGVPGYMVASSVIAVMAQRLVRKICTRCKHPITLSDALLEDAGLPLSIVPFAKFAKGKGCPYCQKKTYRGRIGIYELMVVNGRLRELMFSGQSSAALRTEAIRAGMTTLYCDGLRKVINGITTMDEVYKTAKKTEQEHIAIEKVIKEVLG